jgi:putative ABC transport system permease protein
MSLGNYANGMAVKLSAGDFGATIAQIENIWKQVAPGQPFSYNFMDEAFNSTYRSERRLGQIFVVFTILSILIACLGLFGLATFNAERRIKEIGVRKVLGASVGQITYRLTTDFLKMVGVAILISLPIGWYVMNKWLEDFSYRIEIGFEIFALAAFLAIVVAVLTISYQSIKAALVNPVKSLRTE